MWSNDPRLSARRRGRWLLPLLAALLWGAVALAQPTPVAPGVTYERLVDPSVPWVMEVVRIERGRPELSFEATLGYDQVRGNENLVGQLPEATADTRPIAAVNADFFVMSGEDAGQTIGLHVSQGRLIRSAKGNPTFAWGAAGELAIVEPVFSGLISVAGGGSHPLEGINQSLPENSVVLYTADYGEKARVADGPWVVVEAAGLPLGLGGALTGRVTQVAGEPPELSAATVVLGGVGAGAQFLGSIAEGAEVRIEYDTQLPAWTVGAVSGGPVLVRGGAQAQGGDVRHPRTAVGYNDREMILFTVDGRRPGWSVGMTFDEMAATLLSLGCTEAVNLDGGGSTTMWVRGEVKNRPSDGNLRNVANCLVAMLSGPLGPPAEIILEPEGIWGLPGAVVSVAMEVRDAAMNPLGPDAAPVGVRLNGATHRATSPLVLELGAPGRHVVTLVCGDVTRELPVNVADGPSGLAMDPPSAVAMPGDTIRFAGRLVGPEGQTLALPPGSEWRFSCPESLGTWEEPGLLRIADTGVSGGVRGECVAEEGTAEVVVAQGRLLHDGETVEGVHFTGFPVEEGPTGEVRSREGALVMSYDLGKAEATRAAYVRFDRPLGRALGFTCRLRAVGSSPWVRLAYVDGDGNRATETLVDRLPTDGAWHEARLRLPEGTKAPITLQAIYAVETNTSLSASGELWLDDVVAWVVPEDE